VKSREVPLFVRLRTFRTRPSAPAPLAVYWGLSTPSTKEGSAAPVSPQTHNDPRPRVRATDPGFAALLLESHERLTGTPLSAPHWSSEQEAANWLYGQAPFGLLAHDTSGDPLFTYANLTAQRCFEYDWDAFVGLPSRLSASPAAQEDRDALVRDVTAHHFASGYRGKRVSRTGKRFWIEDVTMWDLIDGEGALHGQAAVFRSWSPADD
jgi:hypothetical protein